MRVEHNWKNRWSVSPVRAYARFDHVRSLLAGASLLAAAAILPVMPARAAAPQVTVAHQVMVGTGLAAGHSFECWLVLDKSSDPTVPGYAVPAGATFRITFPKAFTPKPGMLGSVMLHGWAQGPIPVKFTTTTDTKDPRTVVIQLQEAIESGPADRPGLKAIHLRTSEMNPVKAGDYPIAVEFIEAGPLSGKTQAIVHITSKPVPNVAAYNQLHQGKDQDWQRVKTGGAAPLPIDFLVTLPNAPRTSVSLKATGDGSFAILGDGQPIGSITTSGVPIALESQPFVPGFARLGIVEVHAKAGMTTGTAQITAALKDGTQYAIHLIVEAP
jgi:hypothetical protein